MVYVHDRHCQVVSVRQPFGVSDGLCCDLRGEADPQAKGTVANVCSSDFYDYDSPIQVLSLGSVWPFRLKVRTSRRPGSYTLSSFTFVTPWHTAIHRKLWLN